MMKSSDLSVGVRLRLVRDVYDRPPSPGDHMPTVRAGVTGVVTDVFPDADASVGEPCAYVKLDQHIPELDDWDNTLHVWDDEQDVTPDDWKIIS